MEQLKDNSYLSAYILLHFIIQSVEVAVQITAPIQQHIISFPSFELGVNTQSTVFPFSVVYIIFFS